MRIGTITTIVIVILAATTAANATPQNVSVISPLHTEYNIVNGTIMLKIDTNYIVPNTKYSATAEIEKNPECTGCYDVYVVLHTPATPGYAWKPRKLAPITAIIRPGAAEKNVTIRVIPVGALRNVENPAESIVRCAQIGGKMLRVKAEIEICKAVGCSEKDWARIQDEWNEIRTQNIAARCGLRMESLPRRSEQVLSEKSTIAKYIDEDENVLKVTSNGDETVIETERKGKILGIIPVTIPGKILIRENSVQVARPAWYKLLGWLIW